MWTTPRLPSRKYIIEYQLFVGVYDFNTALWVLPVAGRPQLVIQFIHPSLVHRLMTSNKFINIVSGSNLRIGRGLQSCTSVIQIARPFNMDGRTINLIDTPGFDDTTKSDADVLRMIAAFLATT